jgi:hypothetical protein
MTFAVDPAIPVDGIVRDINDLCGDRDHLVGRENHAIEFELHPTLADEVAGVFVIFKSTFKIAPCWKDRAAIEFNVTNLAEDGITHGHGF